MRVTKEMVQAYKKAEDDILKRMTYISEAILLATPVDANDFDTSVYATTVTNAMKCQNSVSDFRVRGVSIIGKRLCFTTTAVTSCAVVHCCSARQNMVTMISARAHMIFVGGMS